MQIQCNCNANKFCKYNAIIMLFNIHWICTVFALHLHKNIRQKKCNYNANMSKFLFALYLHKLALELHLIIALSTILHYKCIIFALQLHRKRSANTMQFQCKYNATLFALYLHCICIVFALYLHCICIKIICIVIA